jgi:hypothetical protein
VPRRFPNQRKLARVCSSRIRPGKRRASRVRPGECRRKSVRFFVMAMEPPAVGRRKTPCELGEYYPSGSFVPAKTCNYAIRFSATST